MRMLYDWTDDFKSNRLQKVTDPYARNFVSRLLMKDPSKRPDVSHALAHPFLSGQRVARMIGEEAIYDVFLSYRVNSDLHHCELMYEMLTEKGLKVWWDKKCLQAGMPWEEGFCEGLIKSRAIVALISRAGLKNFEQLRESSPCDYVLLEYRLALEFQSFDLLEFVFPVLIGDSSVEDTDPRACTYTDYFESNCSPNCPDSIVTSVEENLRQLMYNQGLGAPVASYRTVKDIYHTILKHQGGFIIGAGVDAFSVNAHTIYRMIDPVRVPKTTSDDVRMNPMSIIICVYGEYFLRYFQDGLTVLLQAVQMKNKDLVASLLLESSLDINTPSRDVRISFFYNILMG